MSRKFVFCSGPAAVRLAAAGAALALGGCSGTGDILAKSQRHADQRNYYQAYWAIANASESYPDDPKLQKVFWVRRRDYLLERGDELLFREKELEAIQVFGRVFALDPGNAEARNGIARAKLKLARRAVSRADTLRLEGQLEEALKVYNRALGYVPEFKDAVEGIEAVNKLFKRRAERAQEHYVLGSRARGELPPSPQRALYHSTLSTELDPSLARAKNLQQQAGMQIAQARFQAAKVMADKGFHSAALAACKRIKDHWPEFPGIGERIATLTKEVEARTMCSQAEMLLRKNEFDQADKLLGKAFDTAISGDVKAIVSGVMRSAKLRRYESEYLKAKDLQRDWKLEAALSEFQRIAKAFSGQKGGFMDVAERIGRIEKEISEATDAWKQGQAAEQKNDLKGAIGFYKEALAVYPGFRGLDRRVAELEAKTKE